MAKETIFNLNQPFINYPVTLIGHKRQIAATGIVDTGAQISFIDSFLLEQMGIEIPDDAIKERIVSYNGLSYEAPRIEVKMIADNKKISIMPVVARSFSMPLILGKDFLKEIKSSRLYIQQGIKQFSALFDEIKKYRERCILIIGCDSTDEGRAKLDNIRGVLDNLGYEGILVRKYRDIESQSIEEKMILFASITKFVICENSYFSGHIDELNICARNRLVTVVVHEKGKYTTWMQSCYPIDFSFIKKIQYTQKTFQRDIVKAVKIAEKLVNERTKALNREYKYRQEWLSADTKG